MIGEDTTPRFSFGLLASTLANALKIDVQSTTNYHSKQPILCVPRASAVLLTVVWLKSVNFLLKKSIFERIFEKILKFFPKNFDNFEKISKFFRLSWATSTRPVPRIFPGPLLLSFGQKTKFQECQFRANTLEDATL